LILKLRGLPFRLSSFPALEEYGVTLTQAEAALDRAIEELEAELASGRTAEFKGKIPRPGFFSARGG
jgi:hypothetical protein